MGKGYQPFLILVSKRIVNDLEKVRNLQRINSNLVSYQTQDAQVKIFRGLITWEKRILIRNLRVVPLIEIRELIYHLL